MKNNSLTENTMAEFGLPDAGWICVTLRSPNQTLTFDASYLVDSVTLLLEALLDIATGTKQTLIVPWADEEWAYDFQLHARKNTASLRVFKFPDGPLDNPKKHKRLAFKQTGTPEALIRNFVKAVQPLAALQDYQEQWSYPFPTQLWQRLNDVVTD